MVILEPDGLWAAALRLRLQGVAVVLRETRTAEACLRELVEESCPLALIHVAPGSWRSRADLIARIPRIFPRATVLTAGDLPRRLLDRLGVAAQFRSLLEAERIAAAVRRHAAWFPEVAATWRDALWERLPSLGAS